MIDETDKLIIMGDLNGREGNINEVKNEEEAKNNYAGKTLFRKSVKEW